MNHIENIVENVNNFKLKNIFLLKYLDNIKNTENSNKNTFIFS